MVACLTGTLLLAAQRGTEPPARPAPPAPHGRLGSPGSRLAAVPAPGLITLAPVYLCLGAMFATIDLSTVDFAQEHGHKPLAGFILGTYALGSAVGGLWYGSRTWHAPVDRRFAVTLCIVVAGTATFWAAARSRRADGRHLLLRRWPYRPRSSPASAWSSSRRRPGGGPRAWPGSPRRSRSAWRSDRPSPGRSSTRAAPRWGYLFAAGCGAVGRRDLPAGPAQPARARPARTGRMGRCADDTAQRRPRAAGGTGRATSRRGRAGSPPRGPRTRWPTRSAARRADGLTVRMTGTGHSFTPAAATDGVMLRPGGLTGHQVGRRGGRAGHGRRRAARCRC